MNARFSWMASLALACGASAPPLEAHERAFAGEHAEIRIGTLRCELPMERLVAVELRFENATVFLEAAPMGASLESLADDEAQTLALTTGAEVERAATFVGARRAVALLAGDRRSLVAMTTPWRVLRTRGSQVPDFSTGSAGSAADFSTGSAGSAADFSTGSAGSAADFSTASVDVVRVGELTFVPPGRFLGGTLRGRSGTVELAADARRCE